MTNTGIGAWLAADYGIVKLDEYWTRESFETDLRTMVDEQKAAYSDALQQALIARAVAIQNVTAEIVQNHDFTLRELSGGGNAEICAVAADLGARYEPMRADLRARNSEALQALRSAMAQHAGNLSVGPMVREIERNLRTAEQIQIGTVRIEGNLPEGFRSERDVSGRLLLNGSVLEFGKIGATESTGFTARPVSRGTIRMDQPLAYALAIEQHLRLKRHRYFGGGGSLDVFDSVGNVPSLQQTINVSVMIAIDEDAGSVEAVMIRPINGQPIKLIVHLRAEPLARLNNTPNCP